MNTKCTDSAIAEYEEKLRQAILFSDVKVLSNLISDDLVFINHEGNSITKEQDILLHQNGIFDFSKIEYQSMIISTLGCLAKVSVIADICVSSSDGQFENRMLFSRLWERKRNMWQVIMVHSHIYDSQTIDEIVNL